MKTKHRAGGKSNPRRTVQTSPQNGALGPRPFTSSTDRALRILVAHLPDSLSERRAALESALALLPEEHYLRPLLVMQLHSCETIDRDQIKLLTVLNATRQGGDR